MPNFLRQSSSRDLQILEELEQEAPGSYNYSLFLCVVSVVLDDDMYIQVQSFISKICYLLYVIRSAMRFVLL